MQLTATFIPDGTGHYFPANKVATAQGAILSKMRLDRHDLLTIKSKGIRTCHTNGDEIVVGESA